MVLERWSFHTHGSEVHFDTILHSDNPIRLGLGRIDWVNLRLLPICSKKKLVFCIFLPFRDVYLATSLISSHSENLCWSDHSHLYRG